MLEGKTRFLRYEMKVKGKKYEKFLINFPAEIARDSQFPFKPGDEILIKVDPKTCTVTLTKAYTKT
ncbi:MAG: hypothetical protein DRP00_04285 [Candidatus Aenigmatarchaeota archaeon]|nr:MAG: hypothetical protein DRP00_04285 [Candidatus Aenigmarchaeota archaeon]